MTMDGAVDQKTGIESKAAEQQTFIDMFQEMLSLNGDPDITLTNIYKEMPITPPASICEIKGHHIDLQTSELQLAAISQCKEVYILSPLARAPVLGRLDSIDFRRGIATISDFSYQELFAKTRGTVRVRFKRPISIIAHAGDNKISGVIHDISLGGCCMNTLVRQGLEGSEDILVELKLMEQSSGQGLCMQIPSSLVRISGDEPPFKCALRFNHNQASEQLLSVYINQRQLQILKELRDSL